LAIGAAADGALMKHIDTRLLNQARAVKLSPTRYDLTPKQIIHARHLANAGEQLPAIMEALGWSDRRPDYCRMILKERYRIIPRSNHKAVHRGFSPLTASLTTNGLPWRPTLWGRDRR
jgi:hypothetical protein